MVASQVLGDKLSLGDESRWLSPSPARGGTWAHRERQPWFSWPVCPGSWERWWVGGLGCPEAGGRDHLSVASLPSQVLSLQDLCCRAVVSCTPVHLVDKLPLPLALRSRLKSFSMANGLNARMMHGRSYSVTVTASSAHKRSSLRKGKAARPPQSPPQRCARNSCKVS